MKRLFTTIVLGGIMFSGKGQDVYFSGQSENNAAINPALIAGKRCPTIGTQFSFNTRNSNQFYRIQYGMDLGSFFAGAALGYANDRAWKSDQKQFSLYGGYHLKLSRRLSLVSGLAFGFNKQEAITSNIPFRYAYDTIPSFAALSFQRNYFDLSFGTLLFSEKFILGVSLNHFLQSDFGSTSLGTVPVSLNIHGAYWLKFSMNSGIRFSGVWRTAFDQRTEEFHYWNSPFQLFQLNGDFNYKKWSLGAGIQSVSYAGTQPSVRAGYSSGRTGIFTAYTFPSSDVNSGQVEVGIKYAFACKPKKRSFRTISCPSFGSGGAYQSGASRSAVNTQTNGDTIHNTETYDVITDNPFHKPIDEPLSTFSIDVDNASYANVRRMINNGQTVVKDAVRIEEFLNYFTYNYPQPESGETFSINTEYADCPWNPEHKLMVVGLRAKDVAAEKLPATHLVFLVDVSGSMADDNKLPLLKESFILLTEKLREQDRVSIVTYSTKIDVVIESVPGNQREKIIKAINGLTADGSTNGEEGLQKAYSIAEKQMIPGGNNRIVLATDGDFNVGITNDGDLKRFIEEKRKLGISISVLGFGMGNIKDGKMEKIADNGDGNYSYIDNLGEARKNLVTEFGGTMFTVAKDVKIQMEFNPAEVSAYRLIGYENRLLSKEDFKDDKKDAGDIGINHTVTAIYEIVPRKKDEKMIDTMPDVDDLKYQKTSVKRSALRSDELLTLKIRYKEPGQTESKLIEKVVLAEAKKFSSASENFRFACAVAAFGMLLRESPYKGEVSKEMIIQLAQGAAVYDPDGRRKEFIALVSKYTPKKP